MHRHTGLPRNLPNPKSKKKIISINCSPLKDIPHDLPSTTHKLNPRKSKNDSTRNCHKIFVKDKPNTDSCSPVKKHQIVHGRTSEFNVINQKKIRAVTPRSTLPSTKRVIWPDFQQKSEKVEESIFVKNIKCMIKNLKNEYQRQNQIKQSIKSRSQSIQRESMTEQSTKFNTKTDTTVAYNRQYHSHYKKQNESKNLAINLNNRIWNNYEGEVTKYNSSQNKEGFGILYFINGDKFMGNFHKNMANGHGTYYDQINQVSIMGLWKDGQLVGNPIFSDIINKRRQEKQ